MLTLKEIADAYSVVFKQAIEGEGETATVSKDALHIVLAAVVEVVSMRKAQGQTYETGGITQ